MTRTIREIRIEGNIAYVPLTKGYEAVIDAEDVHLVAGRAWHAKVTKTKAGEVRSVYASAMTLRVDGKAKNIWLHRVILGLTDGLLFADHIDGDGLNNRRSNLRVATPSENRKNTSYVQPKTSTSTRNERKSAKRQQLKEAGLVRVEVWVPRDMVAEVKALVAALETKSELRNIVA